MAEGDVGDDVEGEVLRFAGKVKDAVLRDVGLVEKVDEVEEVLVDARFEVVDFSARVLVLTETDYVRGLVGSGVEEEKEEEEGVAVGLVWKGLTPGASFALYLVWRSLSRMVRMLSRSGLKRIALYQSDFWYGDWTRSICLKNAGSLVMRSSGLTRVKGWS